MKTEVNSNRVTVIALFVLIIILAAAASLMWQTRETRPVNRIQIEVNQPIRSAPIIKNLKPSNISTINKVSASTPKEHDQLLVSPSLEGTNLDGALQADQNKQLILNIGVRDFFDYFLSTADEIGPEIAIGEIQRYANQYLPEPANIQALDLLEKYLRFKQTEYQIQQMPIAQDRLSDQGAIALMRESFESLRLSRQQLFSPEQDQALFALEDTYAEHTLSTLELMADESLSNTQRRDGLRDLEAELPPELSNSFTETKEANENAELVKGLLKSPLDNAQIHNNLLEQGFSNEKANDIIERRQQQTDFDQEYQQYLSAVKSLDSNQTDFEAQKQGMLKRFFSRPEEQTQAKLRDLRSD